MRVDSNKFLTELSGLQLDWQSCATTRLIGPVSVHILGHKHRVLELLQTGVEVWPEVVNRSLIFRTSFVVEFAWHAERNVSFACWSLLLIKERPLWPYISRQDLRTVSCPVLACSSGYCGNREDPRRLVIFRLILAQVIRCAHNLRLFLARLNR